MAIEISAPISGGELFDKISILEIKMERIGDPAKIANVRHELSLLQRIVAESGIRLTGEIEGALVRLKSANTGLWEAEDRIRDFERSGVFDDRFIRTARSIYRLNDERASAKRELNVLTSSSVVEEKSYSPYNSDGGL